MWSLETDSVFNYVAQPPRIGSVNNALICALPLILSWGEPSGLCTTPFRCAIRISVLTSLVGSCSVSMSWPVLLAFPPMLPLNYGSLRFFSSRTAMKAAVLTLDIALACCSFIISAEMNAFLSVKWVRYFENRCSSNSGTFKLPDASFRIRRIHSAKPTCSWFLPSS